MLVISPPKVTIMYSEDVNWLDYSQVVVVSTILLSSGLGTKTRKLNGFLTSCDRIFWLKNIFGYGPQYSLRY